MLLIELTNEVCFSTFITRHFYVLKSAVMLLYGLVFNSTSSPVTSRPLKTGPISCPKISVTNYQSMLRNIPEQQRPQYCSILQYHIQYMDFSPHHINSNIKIPHTHTHIYTKFQTVAAIILENINSLSLRCRSTAMHRK